MSKALQSVCVFCGSASGASPAYEASAKELGRGLARLGLTLVYGGGGIGLMGASARAALEDGGRVVGIIPSFLRTPEVALEDADLQEVGSMHERKLAMFEQSDAFVVLPGGIGTLEEMIELLSWARLNLHRKPILLLDVEAYWQPLIRLIEHTIEAGFTPPEFRSLFVTVRTVDEVLSRLGAIDAVEGAGAPPLSLT